MIHLVFNEADVKLMKEAMSSDAALEGEILLIRDDFAIGPLSDIYSEAGREARKAWWNELTLPGEARQNQILREDTETMKLITDALGEDENEIVWIWAAQNAHDVCGYYWVLPFLKEFHGRIFILFLNNLPFINDKGGIFYPTKLEEIPAREFIKAKKLAREINLSEFEVDPDEWQKICQENKGIRILEGGKKITQADYDCYDTELRRFVMPDWQKALKIMQNFRQKSKHQVTEGFLYWRIKHLLDIGKFEAQGNIAKLKDLELKTKASSAVINV